MGDPRNEEQVLLKTLLTDQEVYFLLNSPVKLYYFSHSASSEVILGEWGGREENEVSEQHLHSVRSLSPQ